MSASAETVCYVIIVNGHDDETMTAYQDALDVMETSVSWTDDRGDGPVTIRPCVIVRRTKTGEAEGTYQIYPDGDLQILGYSVPLPDALRELTNAAWGKALRI